MQIDAPNYSGQNRRNGRIKLHTGDYIKILTIGFSVLVALITFYIKTDITTKALAEELEAATLTNKHQDEAIIIIQADIKYIKENSKDMKKEQIVMKDKIDEGNKLLWKILGKLENR